MNLQTHAQEIIETLRDLDVQEMAQEMYANIPHAESEQLSRLLGADFDQAMELHDEDDLNLIQDTIDVLLNYLRGYNV